MADYRPSNNRRKDTRMAAAADKVQFQTQVPDANWRRIGRSIQVALSGGRHPQAKVAAVGSLDRTADTLVHTVDRARWAGKEQHMDPQGIPHEGCNNRRGPGGDLSCPDDPGLHHDAVNQNTPGTRGYEIENENGNGIEVFFPIW